ncbi:MAG: sigma-70 family RNA polymerase sigma factor [Clostridia bacterium]|nr:sigma-70 family RNA polymerase sigma factor [Clostridia bacterium]MBQ3814739.1 sigma-70 family RNA polymerase sigma factor [Clostridia bacterium]MBR4186484.1 sigma-70 family RNA polymerase sigma factor [Clostridia bacterium]
MAKDERPAERVWRQAKDAMLAEARRILGDTADAEDAVMDAMERIVKNEVKFLTLGCNETRALAVIYVRNTAIDLYNANAKRPLPLEELPEDLEDPRTPEDEAVERDAVRRLLRLIEAMPPSYRDALLLRVHYGMTNEEIAAVLGLEGGTVRTRLSRAREWLKKHERRSGHA